MYVTRGAAAAVWLLNLRFRVPADINKPPPKRALAAVLHPKMASCWPAMLAQLVRACLIFTSHRQEQLRVRIRILRSLCYIPEPASL
ncbi:hypothetical protein B0T26DRAFT_691986 [Lasiosphaeria miniovina]|uniref:Uncharacterized protein n=1 Tax=Lasiosphaeria miniovina TaxID=1954250 RepID=A0AA40B3J3_9PEZI|nr:uncharacterized protein B0T26DRAFT_691986 [Lasiosphaeria miniovina]KAK0726842.1 hypothetical protein B0T26DRAFT_691986 [Lasiosphaeria miniovina]